MAQILLGTSPTGPDLLVDCASSLSTFEIVLKVGFVDIDPTHVGRGCCLSVLQDAQELMPLGSQGKLAIARLARAMQLVYRLIVLVDHRHEINPIV